jgi:hypothetical protein
MKKKSTSQFAFFNLRVLAALLVGMTGISLALFAANPSRRGTGSSAASAAKAAQLQQKYNPLAGGPGISVLPPGFDCSKIHELHIDAMENFRAHLIMVACGVSEGGKAISREKQHFFKLVKSLLPSPLAYGATDVDVVGVDGTFPSVTQSETYTTANPDDPTQVMVAYNDSRLAPGTYSAVSFSTDGGTTFTDIHAFPNTFGDPVALYNKSNATWYTIWIDGNAGCTMGGFKSNDPLNPASWTHFCVHSGISDDRESGWVENNPSSPFFGRMYVSWNDFGTSCGAGGCLFATFSSDGGATWSTPVEVQTDTSIFNRDVQITGDMSGNGNIYIAGMDEGGGGFPHNDTNYIFKSTDGGVTWNNTYVGSPFPGPGVCASGYFAGMFSTNGCYWRHEGWGQPAAFNNVVHLVYAQHGAGSDPGDVFYIRSTDGGVTFGAPLMLNTDGGTRPQWQPNLSVSPTGTLLATWYDARVSGDSDCVYGSPTSPCYQMFSRKSNDNGATWLPDDTLSDAVSNLPAQPDGNVQPAYAGDYDYGTAIATKHLTSWDDGRVAISNTSQQDVFTDRDLVGFSVTNTDPACGSLVTGTAPTAFIVNLSDPADPSTVQATDFTVNGTPADSFILSNGNATIEFDFNTSPVVQGENTMHIDAGAIHQASNGDPILEFNCTFRYGTTQLMVTDTNPPVGSTFTGPGNQDLAVNWNIPVDPSSVQASDLTVTGVAATVTGVTVTNGNMTTTFTINFTSIFSGAVTASISAGAITDGFGNPNAAFSGNYQYNGSVCDSGIIQNEGWETGDFSPWVIDGHVNDPVVATNEVHSGTHSGFAGGNPQQNTYCEEQNNEPLGDSSFYQEFTVPAGGGTLSFWHKDCTNDSITFDWQDAYITDSNGNILQTIYHLCDTADWTNQLVDMTAYAGQTVWIKFLVHQDGFNPPGDTTGQWVDDVVLYVSQPCASPTPSPSPTPSVTPTPTPSPTRPPPTPRPRPTPFPRPTP